MMLEKTVLAEKIKELMLKHAGSSNRLKAVADDLNAQGITTVFFSEFY